MLQTGKESRVAFHFKAQLETRNPHGCVSYQFLVSQV